MRSRHAFCSAAYQDADDEEIGSFKERFEETYDALILLVIDELYQLDDETVATDGPDEAA
jgi:hypothetical protein